MDISIIIVSWNTRELLKKCLQSIFRYANGADFEVIVVDNASPDGTVEMLENGISNNQFPNSSKFPITNFQIIKNKKNLGFAAANNQGIREARGEYVLLLNPDTELIEDSLTKVVAKMRSDEKIGVLGCKLLNPDRTLQPSVRRFPSPFVIGAVLLKMPHLLPFLMKKYLAKDFNYEQESEADQVMGAFFCIRKSVLDKIGLLDEGYFIWFEEVDFCRQTKKAGYKVVYWPGTSIIHHGGQSFAQQMTLKKQWWFFKSAWRYFTKN